MNEIRGESKTIKKLLSGEKYSIDYYQREYKWHTKQVEELITDLTQKFFESYQESHERSDVEKYGHYFLGSIIISRKDGKRYLIDGQQRLTTLTLLLIYLHNLQKGREDAIVITDLIYSDKYGKMSFNIDVVERNACMQALFEQKDFDPNGTESEAVKNIWGRYHDIEDCFPEELKEHPLPFFMDWLRENVHIVEISTGNDADAYTVFETMNDRGLSLTPTEMLKGYLLAAIPDENEKILANTAWKKQITNLNELAAEYELKELDSDCIKTWLRSKYAPKIRQRVKGAIAEDWDRIGTEFHRWVRENGDIIGLEKSSDFIRFIATDFEFFSRYFQRLITYSYNLTPSFEEIFYNNHNRFTLQYQALLAPLMREDSPDIIERKIRLVARYLDIFMVRRMINFHSIDYSTVQYTMFNLMKELRDKTLMECHQILKDRLVQDKEDVKTRLDYSLTQNNRKHILYILARITSYIEQESEIPSQFLTYITGTGKKAFEVEHIWSNHYENHKDEFAHSSEFTNYRNRLGGLLILQKSFNASYSDKPYEEKVKHYYSQNLLARSLNPAAYENNPGFIRWVKKNKLNFHPHPQFKKRDLEERGELYYEVANMIWNPDRLDEFII